MLSKAQFKYKDVGRLKIRVGKRCTIQTRTNHKQVGGATLNKAGFRTRDISPDHEGSCRETGGGGLNAQ